MLCKVENFGGYTFWINNKEAALILFLKEYLRCEGPTTLKKGNGVKFQIKLISKFFYNLVTINACVLLYGSFACVAANGKDGYLYSKIHGWVR